MANPSPDPNTALVPDNGEPLTGGTIATGNTVTFTLGVEVTETIADLDLAMWLEGDQNNQDTMTVTAFLQSPQGTRVQMMDSYTDHGRDSGSRCRVDNAPLYGDLKADFNLDDESFFAYSDVGMEDYYFNHTALRPAAPLSAFDGEDPSGDWLLSIQNQSSMNISLNCWFLEMAEGDTRFELSVVKVGAGSGTITSSPAGIDCGGNCAATLVENSTITLTATADTGSTFSGWSGDCTGMGACVLTMNTAKKVTATFDHESYLLYLPAISKP